MNLKHVFVLASMMGLGMVGCTTDEGVLEEEILPEIEKSEEVLNYEEAFAEAFGTIDPSHTWNTATRGNAEVSVGYEGNYTLKLYTSNPRITSKQAYLLGEFPIEGNSSVTIEFDMPGTLETVYASLVDEEGHRVIKPAKLNNGTLSLNFGGVLGSRVVTSTKNEILEVSETDPWIYEKKDWEIPLKTLPEEVHALGRKDVYENFLYKANGPFIVYPMYFWTNNTSMELGIYYYDDNGDKIEQAIWHKDDGAFRYEKGEMKWVDNEEYDPNVEGSEKQIQKYVYTWYDLHKSFHWGTEPYKIGGTDKEPIYDSNIRRGECEGILIDLKIGTKFGFYITNGNERFYSEAQYNKKDPTNNPTGCYAATFYNSGNLYLAFEDWLNNHTLDFNDLICKIGTPENIDIVDEDSNDVFMEYIIAYEDLGNPDFDFNDLVMSVQWASGHTNAYVNVLAAGGVLPVYVSFDGNLLFEGKEIHEVFGEANRDAYNGKNTAPLANGFYYPININGDENAMVDVAPIYASVNVGSSFSIANGMSRLSVKMVRNPLEEGSEITTITPPNFDGDTPQAFLVADPSWVWPDEFQKISDKYEEFATWAQNPKSNWYEAVWGDNSQQPGTGGGNEGGGTGGEPEIVPGEDYGTSLMGYLQVNNGNYTMSIPAEVFNEISVKGTKKVLLSLGATNEGGGYSLSSASIIDSNNQWVNIIGWKWIDMGKVTSIEITLEQVNQIIIDGPLNVALHEISNIEEVTGIWIKAVDEE